MKRGLLAVLITGGVLGSIAFSAQRPAAPVMIEVFKTPTCGCCAKWVDYLKAEGFTVQVTDLADLSAVKATHKVPGTLQSCHTATVGGYAIEGHVPIREIRKLLAERPPVAGIAVAGMPYGSPGMEVGDVKHPYDVMAFDAEGTARVFGSYR